MSTRSMMIALAVALVIPAMGEAASKTMALDSTDGLDIRNAKAEVVTYKGKKGLRVIASDPGAGGGDATRPFVMLKGVEFGDGTIELELAGSRGEGAGGGARGFVGLAFRVGDAETYECFYLRPTNGRAENQERRNHSAQYISHPEHTWFKFRKETPSRYEAYVDLVPGEWTKVKIEVKGTKARLYVHGNEQPTLIVNDLKRGEVSGGVVLWLERTTVAHYRDLRITE